MKRFAILALIAFMAVSLVMADDKTTTFDRFPSALGAHGIIDFAGGNGLGGLSYQRWFGSMGL